ncbi:hypothetical protein F5X97DRAFT_326640 [Nemania serpens]|nr:hypothetical protein F5X97DRAFT_326640 [Nemania serpens]
MANVDTGAAQRQTISDYGLIREVIRSRLRSMDFMGPYTNPDGAIQSWAWTSYIIRPLNDELMVSYSISTLFNAYVTEAAFLFEETPTNRGLPPIPSQEVEAARLTPMRYRDMMLDSYLDAGGDLKKWRYIGVKSVMNGKAHASAVKCFRRAGKDFTQAGSVEVLPNDEESYSAALANPFTGGVRRLLGQHEKEMGYARMKRIIFISMGAMPRVMIGIGNPLIHLVIELCRPGDDGYPDDQGS